MTRQHLMADMVVQGLGLACALVGGVFLAHSARDGTALAAVAVYGLSLLTMFVCSILNALPAPPRHKARRRALDHAAIFLLIAGTYTPFCLLVIGGALGTELLIALWILALAGMAAKILFHPHFQRARIMIYALMGWSGLGAAATLAKHLPTTPCILLLAGGVFFTLGAPVHRLEHLPYHSAIWHGCVLCGTSLHWGAVLLAVTGAA